jgi:hypothetical protein
MYILVHSNVSYEKFKSSDRLAGPKTTGLTKLVNELMPLRTVFIEKLGAQIRVKMSQRFTEAEGHHLPGTDESVHAITLRSMSRSAKWFLSFLLPSQMQGAE